MMSTGSGIALVGEVLTSSRTSLDEMLEALGLSKDREQERTGRETLVTAIDQARIERVKWEGREDISGVILLILIAAALLGGTIGERLPHWMWMILFSVFVLVMMLTGFCGAEKLRWAEKGTVLEKKLSSEPPLLREDQKVDLIVSHCQGIIERYRQELIGPQSDLQTKIAAARAKREKIASLLESLRAETVAAQGTPEHVELAAGLARAEMMLAYTDQSLLAAETVETSILERLRPYEAALMRVGTLRRAPQLLTLLDELEGTTSRAVEELGRALVEVLAGLGNDMRDLPAAIANLQAMVQETVVMLPPRDYPFTPILTAEEIQEVAREVTDCDLASA